MSQLEPVRQMHLDSQVNAWLAEGGHVLAANDRAARSLTAAFHQAQQAAGKTAWLTPSIFSWDAWVRDRWADCGTDRWADLNRPAQMPLNSLQEQSVWMRIILATRLASRPSEGLLHPHRLAAAAQRAHALLCSHAPGSLASAARSGWQGDPAEFSMWLAEFERYCRREGVVSSAHLALDLADELKLDPANASGKDRRPALFLVGFDRLLPTQRALLDAWGPWQQWEQPESANLTRFYIAEDSDAELNGCVQWLRERQAANPKSRLMVIAPGLQNRRGELERALLDSDSTSGTPLDFEFSLGVPLSRVGLARAAVLVLRWLQEPISEPEVDWLIGCGHTVASAEEELALLAAMRHLRERGQERPQWDLVEFTANVETANRATPQAAQATWTGRMLAARDRLMTDPERQSPLALSSLAAELLQAVGWPGFRLVSSEAYQARQRWQGVLEDCASLGFDGSLFPWPGFVAELRAAVSETIFAVESTGAPIQITEPLPSAGQLADGIWFLGAEEEGWPSRGQAHPLLPIGLQRQTEMPHASPDADWRVAQQATLRLLTSADEVVFSYARRGSDAEARPSRLVAQLVGSPTPMPASLLTNDSIQRHPLTESFEDHSQIPFPLADLGGGAGTLTNQSLCPFLAFATARLGASDWQPAEAGLNARQRGQLLHGVLSRVWSGNARGGLSTLAELTNLPDLASFVSHAVHAEMDERFGAGRKHRHARRFPERYLKLEATRLTRLVSEWLEYERHRLPFTVLGTEADADVQIAGLNVRLRMDRVDALADGSRLILDYKSGLVGPKAWEGDRPDDVQLALYATYAVDGELGGLSIARVRPGKIEFCGRVYDAENTLIAGLSRQNGLLKAPLTTSQLEDWRDTIERLGQDFLSGRADVDPKDPAKTCERCHLHAVCRIYESQPLAALSAEESNDSGKEEAPNA